MKETQIKQPAQFVKGVRPNSTATATAQPITIQEYTGEYQEGIRIAVYGDHGTGKSRLGATGRGDIGLIPLDIKAKQTVIKTARDLGRKVFLPEIDLVRASNPLQAALLKPACHTRTNRDGEIVTDARMMIQVTQGMDIFKEQPKCCAIHFYRWHVQRVKYALIEMCKMDNIRTVIIDSGTNLWDDILFANHGRTEKIEPRDRGSDNREMQEILGITVGKDLVITHKQKEVWVNNKPSGKYEWAGYGHLGYEVGALLWLTRNPKTGEFYADIVDCQAAAELYGDGGKHDKTGLEGGEINMQQLALTLYPDGDWSEWG